MELIKYHCQHALPYYQELDRDDVIVVITNFYDDGNPLVGKNQKVMREFKDYMLLHNREMLMSFSLRTLRVTYSHDKDGLVIVFQLEKHAYQIEPHFSKSYVFSQKDLPETSRLVDFSSWLDQQLKKKLEDLKNWK